VSYSFAKPLVSEIMHGSQPFCQFMLLIGLVLARAVTPVQRASFAVKIYQPFILLSFSSLIATWNQPFCQFMLPTFHLKIQQMLLEL